MTADAINAADLATIAPQYVAAAEPVEGAEVPAAEPVVHAGSRNCAPAGTARSRRRLPGAIDGFDGDNVRKAVVGFELMQGLPPTARSMPTSLRG